MAFYGTQFQYRNSWPTLNSILSILKKEKIAAFKKILLLTVLRLWKMQSLKMFNYCFKSVILLIKQAACLIILHFISWQDFHAINVVLMSDC